MMQNFEKNIVSSVEKYCSKIQELVIKLTEDTNIKNNFPVVKSSFPFDANFQMNEVLQDYEVHLIKIALKATHGNQTKAAKLLGVKKTTLNIKIKKFDIKFRLFRY